MSVNFGGRIRQTCRIEESTIQPLVSAVTSASPPPPPCIRHSNPPSCYPCPTCFKNHHVCSRSKGAILILLWNIIVGVIYGTTQDVAVALAVYESHHGKEAKTLFKYSMYKILVGFGGMAVGQMLLFPIGGLLADIWYGRYKIVTFSLVKITLGFVFVSITAIIYLKYQGHSPTEKTEMAIFYFSIVMSVILLLLGFSGFQSNAVQFGLDQLLEAPSETLSLFLHWYVWTGNLGEMIARIIGSVLLCNKHLRIYAGIVPIFFAVLTSVMLFVTCYKHQWFYCEPRTQNPYGLVYKVLRFVAKHKQPLQRSAMTYTGDIIPNRMDFAKTRFGGPFRHEVVEDVKTLLRILVMLFFICPVFYYHISSSSIFPIYALHMGESIPITNKSCTSNWLIFQSGNLAYMVSFVVIPLYIIFILPHIPKWAPRILHRLWVGILVIIVCMCTMSMLYAIAINHHHAISPHVNITCLFIAEYRDKHFSETLGFPAATLIIPNILAGIGLPIINITTLEFISAQSPHTMKGLLLGAFYTVRGIFILVGCLVVFPFTTSAFEESTKSPFLECGFIYYLLNTLLGLVCIAVATAGNRWYRYREREEKPYDYTYVENVFHHYIYARSANASKEMPPEAQIDSSILTYGTVGGN